MIKTPYLLFLGDAPDRLAAKVAIGIKDWRPEHAVAQFRMPGCGADLGIADMSLQDAKDAGGQDFGHRCGQSGRGDFGSLENRSERGSGNGL